MTGNCPKDHKCPKCGKYLEQAGHYNKCPDKSCGYSCRWFTNAGGLGGTAQELDMYSLMPDGDYDPFDDY